MRYNAVKLPDDPAVRLVVRGSADDKQPNLNHAERYASSVWTGECFLVHEAGPHAGKPVFFRLHDHEDRFEDSVGRLRFLPAPCDREERERIRFVLAALNAPRGDNYLSLEVATVGGIGVMPADLRTKLFVTTDDINPRTKPYASPEKMRQGFVIRISEQHPDFARSPSRLSGAKTASNYAVSNIVKYYAMTDGADDGIVWGPSLRHFAELSVMGLVLLLKDGTAVTPSLETNCLSSITVRTAAAMLREKWQIPVRWTLFGPEVLSEVRGAFGAGTANGWIFIRRFVTVDGRTAWECADPEAERVIRQGAEDHQDLIRGKAVRGFTPDPRWFTPVPDEVLDRHAPNLFRSFSRSS